MTKINLTQKQKSGLKLSDLRHILLTFLLIGSTTHQIIAQTSQPFKDLQLEETLQKNKVNEAKTLIEVQLAQQELLTLDQRVYYLNRKSQTELLQGAFSESLASAKQSEKLLNSSPQSMLWGETYRAVCYAYIRTGKLDSALLYAEKLYDFSKKENDFKFRRAALVAMGNISLQNKGYQKSLDFYLEALSVTESTQDSSNLKVDNYNIGLAYSQLDEHEKSNEFLLKSAQMAEIENALDLLGRAYGSIADNYLDLKNYEAQETYLRKANKIAEKTGNKQLLAMGLASLTEAALQKNKYSQAIQLAKESLENLQDRPVIQLQAKVDSMLYVAFKSTGDYKNALTQLEGYDKTLLTIRNQAQKEKLDQLTLEFEVEKKDLLIQNQATNLEKEKAKNRLLIIGIASISMFGFFLSYINIKNSKTRKLLFRKEKEIDSQLNQITHVNSSNPEENILSLDKELEESQDHQKLFREVVQIIQERKLYLDPKFNQQSLLNEFATNRQYLYEAISKNGDDNFRGLINRFRVNEAKYLISEKIKNEMPVDFGTLSEKAGFNSYPTFYRSFKNLTGLTPNEFTKEFKFDLKNKNSLSDRGR
jgi:AraC-like DNA-binding protein